MLWLLGLVVILAVAGLAVRAASLSGPSVSERETLEEYTE